MREHLHVIGPFVALRQLADMFAGCTPRTHENYLDRITSMNKDQFMEFAVAVRSARVYLEQLDDFVGKAMTHAGVQITPAEPIDA